MRSRTFILILGIVLIGLLSASCNLFSSTTTSTPATELVESPLLDALESDGVPGLETAEVVDSSRSLFFRFLVQELTESEEDKELRAFHESEDTHYLQITDDSGNTVEFIGYSTALPAPIEMPEFEVDTPITVVAEVDGQIVPVSYEQLSPAKIDSQAIAAEFENMNKAALKSSVRADVKNLSTAIETYWVDNDRYPAEAEMLMPDYMFELPTVADSGTPYSYCASEDGSEFLVTTGGESFGPIGSETELFVQEGAEPSEGIPPACP